MTCDSTHPVLSSLPVTSREHSSSLICPQPPPPWTHDRRLLVRDAVVDEHDPSSAAPLHASPRDESTGDALPHWNRVVFPTATSGRCRPPRPLPTFPGRAGPSIALPASCITSLCPLLPLSTPVASGRRAPRSAASRRHHLHGVVRESPRGGQAWPTGAHRDAHLCLDGAQNGTPCFNDV